MNVDPQHHGNCWITSALDAYESRLLRYVMGMVGDINIAREITQETFLRLCSQRQPEKQAEIQSRLASWLFRVSRNAAIDYLRKERRMQTTDVNSIDQLVGQDNSGDALSDGDPLVASEQANSLGQQIKKLPASQQEVIRLRFENQMSYKQIAEITGHTTSNVGFMLHTAIKKLRGVLAPEMTQPKT